MSQKIGPVICDSCGADLTTSAYSPDYRIVMQSERTGTPKDGFVYAMSGSNPLPNGPHHFCDVVCLAKWTAEQLKERQR